MRRIGLVITVLGLLLAACGGGEETTDGQPTTTSEAATTQPEAETTTTTEGEPGEEFSVPSHLAPMAANWETDFSQSTVDLEEIKVGIPASDPRDLIRPIDDPVFIPVSEGDWVADQEPGVLLEIDGDARFYPLSVLTRHEIANDEVGGVPVAVTYCPLCNTAVTFDRRFQGDVLRLGVSGLLRNSDLVMWDDLTESLWQQITGEAIVGELAGSRLTPIGTAIVRWADFADEHPDGQVMAEDQGFGQIYGVNPYVGYSSRAQPFGFFEGEIDDRFPALERVVGVSLAESEKAYPFSTLQEERVANDEIDGRPVVVFWGAPDTADALDQSQIAASRGVGTGVAYDPVVDGRTLTFQAVDDDTFTDTETGSAWTLLGTAVDGELAGAELALLPHRNEFWFAWQGFFPDAEVWEP